MNSPANHTIDAGVLKARAGELGFDLCGICPAVPPPGAGRLQAWLAAGYAGQMHYLPDRADAYARPQSVLAGARSIVMLAMNYRTAEPIAPQPGQGKVSRYAWGHDYHEIIRDRLAKLADWVRGRMPQVQLRGVVDTAPLLEREFAQLAGLGWIGKNTLLLNKQLGSWFFLAALLVDAELEYDLPHETDHCGTCRACLDACPTNAFVDAYVLDARKCISYLTIELRDAIPAQLRPGLGEWVFGCDVCQDVCPWNHRAPLTMEPAFNPGEGMNPLELAGLFFLDDDRLPHAISSHAAVAHQTPRTAAQRGHRAGKPAEFVFHGGPHPRIERRGFVGPGGVRLGAGPRQFTRCASCPSPAIKRRN